jgi:hypothetical protein
MALGRSPTDKSKGKKKDSNNTDDYASRSSQNIRPKWSPITSVDAGRSKKKSKAALPPAQQDSLYLYEDLIPLPPLALRAESEVPETGTDS